MSPATTSPSPMGNMKKSFSGSIDHWSDRLTMVGMDACLMANWEIARITADYADVYVASQATESIEGWAFHTAIADLNEAPDMDAMELGTTFAQRFHETGDSTLSVVDLEELAELDAINDLANSILSMDNPRSKVRPQARRAVRTLMATQRQGLSRLSLSGDDFPCR